MTTVLGLLLIVTSVGWAAQWALTDYWCKRCRDLEATQIRPRHSALTPDPIPTPVLVFKDIEPVEQSIPVGYSVRPASFRVPSLGFPSQLQVRWEQPRSFPPASLIPCPRR